MPIHFSMNRNWIVYKHTSPSDKVYIGITSRKPHIRWGKNGRGYKKHPHFYNAILKYGWDNMLHEVLYSNLTEQEAQNIEISLISYYKAKGLSYNIAEGGNLGMTGHKWTEEQRAKMPKRDMRGTKNPNYGNHKLAGSNNPMYGRTHSEESRRKISMAKMGGTCVPSELHIKKLIERSSKPVLQLDEDNNIVAKFQSSIAAARFYGKSQATANHIAECCRGLRKRCLNSKWIYNV